jgi:TPR repeat protein
MVKKTLLILSLLAFLTVPSYAADPTTKPSDVAALNAKAEKGDADAQDGLGLLYANGQGIPQDYAEALKWFRKAAEQGNAQAQSTIGYLYANGQGVEQDYTEAAKWYRQAAEQGDAAAQLHLGEFYDTGRGVKQDYAEAYFWYSLVADKAMASFRENAAQAAKRFTPEQIAAVKKRVEEWKPTPAPGHGER